MRRFPVLLAAAGLLVVTAACTASSTSSAPPSADFLAALGPLTSFQQTQCGIKFQ